ncbi:MAG: flagellar basal body P-ring formation chaperone FlgA [Planctomycetota bacterium]
MMHSHIHRMLTTIGALMLATTVAADSIQLRRKVRLDHDHTDIRLRDIATLDGTDALRLGSLIVATRDDPFATIEIDVADVFERLDAAGAHWGLINLSGQRVVVRPSQVSRLAAPVAMKPISIENPTTSPTAVGGVGATIDIPTAADLLKSKTLRAVIADRLIAFYRVEPADLRLSFKSQDEAVLDMDARTHEFIVQNKRSERSESLLLHVGVIRDNARINEFSIGVTPTIRVDACTTIDAVRAGQTIRSDDVRTESMWVTPQQRGLLLSAAECIGHEPARSLRKAQPIRRDDIKRPTLMHRGDTVTIQCIVGDMIMTMPAVARGKGKRGDTIEFNLQNHREPFYARIETERLAVVDAQTMQVQIALQTARKD